MPQNTSPLRWLSAVALCAAAASPAVADQPSPQDLEFFEKKIRPLLAENCHRCHSAAEKQRGGLTLDSRESALRGGDTGPAVVPGRPEQSRLIEAVGYANPDLQMPPRGKLSAEQIADLTRWVKLGAPWPPDDEVVRNKGGYGFDLKERAKHWSFQPVRRPGPPEVKDSDWPLSPVDNFVLARLEAAGLKPNPPADRRTLLRRVTFDLTGLPPTPGETEAFVRDASPDAFEKVVDRLLASPHYGERWARHWLDLVRFAETQGHEFDFDMHEAWRYRDYVIRAFNDDVPYDCFVTEHVAGDLLPEPRRHATEGFNESVLGTGFWFLGEGKHSPVDVRGDQADRADNQIDVFSKTFLGLTVACARCHDHKFDPIRQADYYALMGYLESSRYQKAFIDDPAPLREKVAGLRELRAAMADAAVPAAAAALRARLPDLAAAVAADKALSSAPDPDPAAHQTFADFSRHGFARWFVTGEAFGDGPAAAEPVYQADAARPVQRLAAPGTAHSGTLSARLAGVLRSPTFEIGKRNIHLQVLGRGGQVRVIVDGFQLIRNPIYGGLERGIDHGDELRWATVDVSMWQGHRAYLEFRDDGEGYIGLRRLVFSDGGPPPEPANPLLRDLAAAADSPGEFTKGCERLLGGILDQWQSGRLTDQPDAAARAVLLDHLLRTPGTAPAANAPGVAQTLQRLLQDFARAEAGLPQSRRAMAMADGNAVDQYLFIRGSHKNRGETVPRRFLEVFGTPPAPDHGSGRLELARQLTDPANRLVARVMVNRIWQHHFGEGIVRSVDNFGLLGEPPTHPELLDWLASEFVERGWSVKHMHRLMLLSRTYQMSSRPDPAAAAKDPQNRLLHRMPVRRLEAEAIRDALLAVSGRLDRTMFGPSVPPHLTPFMAGRGRPGGSGPLDGAGRRSIYINVRRNFLTPMFLVFDYPVPFSTMGRRSVSNVPAQALTMMNNPFVAQQTDLWAQQLLAAPGLTPQQRIDSVYRTALGRPPSDEEAGQLLAFLSEHARGNGRGGALRAWQELCHVVVNLKEFIYLN